MCLFRLLVSLFSLSLSLSLSLSPSPSFLCFAQLAMGDLVLSVLGVYSLIAISVSDLGCSGLRRRRQKEIQSASLRKLSTACACSRGGWFRGVIESWGKCPRGAVSKTVSADKDNFRKLAPLFQRLGLDLSSHAAQICSPASS